MRRFVRECAVTGETRILDIGGTPDCWRLAGCSPRVVLLNMPRAKDDLAGAEAWVGGDGRMLPFRDGAFSRHSYTGCRRAGNGLWFRASTCGAPYPG